MLKKPLLAIDHYALAEAEGLEDEMEADLVSFKSGAEHRWIHQALGPPSKWWVLRSNKVPMLLEIRELIRAKKTKASSSRLPKQSDCLVRLKVRSRLIFIQKLHQPNELGPHRRIGEQDWLFGVVRHGVGEGHHELPELTGGWSAEACSRSFWFFANNCWRG